MSFLLQGIISHERGAGGRVLDERDVYRMHAHVGR
jgi:hypothetical protein